MSTWRGAFGLGMIASLVLVTTPARAAPAPVGELSSGGTDRGQFEFALGSITLAVAASLGVVGSMALATGLEKRRDGCKEEFEASRCQLVPPALDLTSAGLSFGLMVPLTVAGALLLRKGTRIRRDHRRFHAQSASVSFAASRNGVGLSWTLRY